MKSLWLAFGDSGDYLVWDESMEDYSFEEELETFRELASLIGEHVDVSVTVTLEDSTTKEWTY